MMTLKKQAGISLVEILVALVISLFLLGGIIQVYMGNKTTFSFTNAIAEVQENGRFALDTISQDLRLAGEWGCIAYDPDDTSNINDTLNAGTVPGYDTDFHDFLGEEGIEGTNNAGLNGSDTITIRGGKPGQANIENPFRTATTQELITTPVSNISAGDIVLVARCGANDLLIPFEADILRVTSILPFSGNSQRQITLSANKSQQFENDATLIELQTVTYSIANGANGEPSLFRTEFGVAQELVEGIERMQIWYGIDTDNDQFPNQYVDSTAVVDFDDVVAVRVNLLARSIEDFVTDAAQRFTFDGTTITPTDRRIRQEFTTTIALRNRIGSS
ncbi:MAG: PilW family protein [Pseudomonadota bacterium]